jgi:hypothetical protein
MDTQCRHAHRRRLPKTRVAQLICKPTRLFRTEVHGHRDTSRALPAGIEPRRHNASRASALPTRPQIPMLCCAVLCCAVLCCAVLCCAVLCCAVLCCAVLRCAVLYCVVLSISCQTEQAMSFCQLQYSHEDSYDYVQRSHQRKNWDFCSKANKLSLARFEL